MKRNDWIAAMERIAPKELALPFDNVGLNIGTEREEISRVLVALDLTPAVAAEAVQFGADLVLTHHPQFFHGVKQVLPTHADTAAAYQLIRHGIAHFSAHTNLDAADGGVNDVLCALLGVEGAVALPPDHVARLGTVPAGTTLGALARRVETVLGTRAQVLGNLDAAVSRVMVVGGSGSSEVELAVQNGADAFVTGECGYHAALAASVYGLNLIVAGHYETEHIVLLPLIKRLQRETNDVLYQIALSETSPFHGAQEGST